MQANELWAGTEYAYVYHRYKGVETPLNAKRVKLVSITKELDTYSERRRTYAIVTFPDNPDPTLRSKIPARNIIDFWDEYQDRLTVVKAERAEQELKREEQRRLWQAEREQRERERRQKAAQEAIAIRELKYYLSEKLWVPFDSIKDHKIGYGSDLHTVLQIDVEVLREGRTQSRVS